jgi:hypothetical protein
MDASKREGDQIKPSNNLLPGCALYMLWLSELLDVAKRKVG